MPTVGFASFTTLARTYLAEAMLCPKDHARLPRGPDWGLHHHGAGLGYGSASELGAGDSTVDLVPARTGVLKPKTDHPRTEDLFTLYRLKICLRQ